MNRDPPSSRDPPALGPPSGVRNPDVRVPLESPPAWERAVRRGFHLSGVVILLLFALPQRLFGFLPRDDLLFLGLGVVAGIEVLRWAHQVRLPAMRAFELRRPASFVFFGLAITIVILLFPESLAIAAIAGASLVDPLLGELRSRRAWNWLTPWVPGAAYVAICAFALSVFGSTPVLWAIPVAAATAVVALLAEGPRLWWLDDDLLMTMLPAIFLAAVAEIAPFARIT